MQPPVKRSGGCGGSSLMVTTCFAIVDGGNAASRHGENHPEARLAGHHLRVGFRGPFERHCLDHGGDATKGAEPERRVSRRRVTRERTLDFAAAEQQVRTRDLNWLGAPAKYNCDAARAQALDGVRDRLSPGARYQNDCRSAERL